MILIVLGRKVLKHAHVFLFLGFVTYFARMCARASLLEGSLNCRFYEPVYYKEQVTASSR